MRCAPSWTAANANCGQACPGGSSAECPALLQCWAGLSTAPCLKFPPPAAVNPPPPAAVNPPPPAAVNPPPPAAVSPPPPAAANPPPPGASGHRVPRGVLVDKLATPETRALMRYLCDMYGTAVLSGQYEMADINWITANTNKTPAVGGFDLADYSPSRVAHGTVSKTVEKVIAWDKRGGITTLTWHWNAPNQLIDQPGGQEWWFGFYTWATTFDIQAALTNTTAQDYLDLLRDIDAIAVQLKRIQAAGVPVIFRPLHEAEGGWFWWGAKGPGPAKALYALLYDRYVNHHQIHNLIWCWNSARRAWYPGNGTVDMVSADTYPAGGDHSAQATQYNALVKLVGDSKVVALSENGPIPDPALLQAERVHWSWFATWGGFEKQAAQNALAFVRYVYSHPYVVNLDRLPKFKVYA